MTLITDKPEIQVRRQGDYEVTLTPVAFRASRKHPWRSFETANPRYRYDVDHNFYEVIQGPGPGGVLYTRTERFLGHVYETHCQQCGAYTMVSFPSTWSPRPVNVTCLDCISKNTHTPQDGLRFYTPEYQNTLKPGARR